MIAHFNNVEGRIPICSPSGASIRSWSATKKPSGKDSTGMATGVRENSAMPFIV
jgi:hypothetical protein